MLLNSDRFASPFAGIRFGAYAARALPLCGAAVTFFVPQGDFLRGASAKKVTKESGLTPPILDRYPRAPNVPILHTPTNVSMRVARAPIDCLILFMHLRFRFRHRISRAALRQTYVACRSAHETTPTVYVHAPRIRMFSFAVRMPTYVCRNGA